MAFSVSGDVNRNVNIVFSGRDNASSAMRNISSTASRTTSIMTKLGAVLKTVAVAAAAALAAGAFLAARGLISATKAAYADDVAMKKLAFTQMKAQDATKAQTEATAEWIDKMELSTRFADDEMRPALSALALTGMSVQESQEMLALAMDVAEAKGKPLLSVSEALAKAYNGQTTSLQRLGVKVTDANGDALELSEIMKQLEDRTKGAAKQAAKTDPFTTMGHAFEQIKEEVGAGLLPELRKFSRWITGVAVPWIKEKLIPRLKELIGWIGQKLRDAAAKIQEWWDNGGKETMKALWERWKDLKDTAEDLWEQVENLTGKLNAFSGSDGVNAENYDGLKLILDGIAWALEQITSWLDRSLKFWSGWAKGAAGIVEALTPMADFMRTLAYYLGLVIDALTRLDSMPIPEINLPDLPGLASGGYVKRRGLGGWTKVGEHGPELINNRGYVKTHSQTMGMQGGGNVIHIHGAIDPVNTARQIERILAKGGRVSGGIGLATA